MKGAIVFAYSDMGVRCLKALLSLDVVIDLVVTHQDNPDDNIWFDSVAQLAHLNRIPVITPDDPNTPDVIDSLKELRPRWIFSFYYRYMLSAELLATAGGAYNMHGSMLPKYRGKSPTNWAVLHGETITGASLHEMALKPDAGALVDQEPVVILPNDSAAVVYQRTCFAAEKIILRSVPALLLGELVLKPNDISKGSYFSGRSAADGEIDINMPAHAMHNLIRAVAPPYPGAFYTTADYTLSLDDSYFIGESAEASHARLYVDGNDFFIDCCDGKRLQVISLKINGDIATPDNFKEQFGEEIPLKPRSNI